MYYLLGFKSLGYLQGLLLSPASSPSLRMQMNRSDLDAATDLAPLVNATQHGGVDDEQAVLILNQRRVVEVVLVMASLDLSHVHPAVGSVA